MNNLKEFFRQHRKILYWLILGVVVLAAAGAVWYYLNPTQKQTTKDYYQELADKCADSCCAQSVKTMWENGYKLATESNCPEGFQENQSRCVSSYNWCEPKEIRISNDCGPEPPAMCGNNLSLVCLNGEWQCGQVEESIDTFNWQIYRNEEYGFEFKYPLDWDIVNNPTSLDLVQIYGKESVNNGDDVNPVIVNYHLVMKVYDGNAINSLVAAHRNNIKKIQISGIEASRLEYSQSLPRPDNEIKFDEVIVYHNGKTFRLNLNNNVQKFNQILSTFKFIE